MSQIIQLFPLPCQLIIFLDSLCVFGKEFISNLHCTGKISIKGGKAMFYILLTQEERKLKQEVRTFVKEKVPSSLIRAMDAEEVKYPKEYITSLAAQNLLGLRFSKEWGGRGMKWAGEVAAIEEIGVLGSGLTCLYSLVSICGEAIHRFGTPEQKEKYLKPTLAGKLCCAEALTEPRGGSVRASAQQSFPARVG